MRSLRSYLRGFRGVRAQRISVNLPFGMGGVELVPNKAEQRAAWCLYVELTTRIAIQPFDRDHGLMREVLTSLYSLFGLTRQVLREAGPEVAHGPNSLGPLAIDILTKGLAPFTTRWHQSLSIHERSCPEGVSAHKHERDWEQFQQMTQELESLQQSMKQYAVVLAEIAGIKQMGS